jgi:hypothetical protein
MLDLFHTGLQFDLRSAQGKLIASLMAALAELERDLLRERVCSAFAAARKRGVVFGRRPGQRIKADRYCRVALNSRILHGPDILRHVNRIFRTSGATELSGLSYCPPIQSDVASHVTLAIGAPSFSYSAENKTPFVSACTECARKIRLNCNATAP